MGDILKVLTELSFDNLFVIVGLGFIAVGVIGNISGKINPDARGRIAAAIVGVLLVGGGLWMHVVNHSFRVTALDVSPPGNRSGACPMQIPLQGIIEASGTGGVIYYFEFSDGNATPPDRIEFDRADSTIVTKNWDVRKSMSGAWVRLDTMAPARQASRRSAPFAVACQQTGSNYSQGETDQPAPATAVPPPPPPTLAPSPDADSIELVDVSPRPGTHLNRGKPLPFDVSLDYNLVSADVAILSLSTAQFNAGMGGCRGSGGELVDAVQVPVQRGRHQQKVSITWSGDTGIASKGRVYGAGFLGFAPMFWASNNGARRERIKFFGVNPDVCYQFGP
jgi:hypothetical protein